MFKRFVLLWMVMLLVAGCGAPASEQPAPVATTATGARQAVTIAMPYIPDVQFAYLYVADKKGYFADAGLDVTFDYNFENDIPQRLVQGTVQFGLVSGTSMLLARAQGLTVRTVATTTQKNPVAFYSKKSQNVTSVAAMKGKKIGIPGRFGAAYIGLLALLYAEKIPESDLDIQEIGFTQVQALSQDNVQVASGYANNEPIKLAKQGIELNVITVADVFPLASDGLAVSEAFATAQPNLVRGFTTAMLRGMQDVINNPEEAFTLSLDAIPELQSADDATKQINREVLAATIPSWQSELTQQNGLGYTDRASWEATYQFLRESSLLKGETDVALAFTNEFLK